MLTGIQTFRHIFTIKINLLIPILKSACGHAGLAHLQYNSSLSLNTSQTKNMRPDKAKVVDEVWDDARIESFLDKGPMGDENAEFSVLLHAYRSMRAEDFALFIEKFKAKGGRVDAKGKDGRTLGEVIALHAKSKPFQEILAG